jgi:hypothetical protein
MLLIPIRGANEGIFNFRELITIAKISEVSLPNYKNIFDL